MRFRFSQTAMSELKGRMLAMCPFMFCRTAPLLFAALLSTPFPRSGHAPVLTYFRHKTPGPKNEYLIKIRTFQDCVIFIRYSYFLLSYSSKISNRGP